MKKRFAILAFLLMSIGAAYATVTFISSCGKTATTVGESYFSSREEAERYYEDLNELLCGTSGPYTIVQDDFKELPRP
ncbi:MAG: hypothetical protein ACI30S_08100 [Muribaculaceae bacterium]